MKTRATLILMALLAMPAFGADRGEAEVALAQAETALQAAAAADATRDAPVEMRAADDNLAAARGAFERRKWTDSAMNAEKAKADADLAAARSREKRASAATAEIEASVATLRRELGRGN
ncbi:MAG: DUF4398 domain-containing protein [Xanthomonadales bacterium]|nr:DUF4398 domain-containing protein [Xanthomonadales bacterium]